MENLSSSLAGRTIVLTRSAEHNEVTRPLFEARGASVLCFPTIEIHDSPSWDAVDSVLRKLAEFTDVCFTSQYAVKKLVERARAVRPKALETLSTRTLIAVGEKTRLTLESLGFPLSHMPQPSQSSANGIVEMLRTQSLEGRKFLYPKGNISRDDLSEQLRALGASIEDVVVYQTRVPESTFAETIKQKLQQKEIDVVTFFSPSAVHNCIELIGEEAVSNVVIAAVGNTTADAVTKAGLKVTIRAEQPTAESLVQSIERYYQNIGS